MRRVLIGLTVAGLLCVLPALGGEKLLREDRWATVDPEGGLPLELLDPEGRTRWDLSGLSLLQRSTKAIAVSPDDPDALVLISATDSGSEFRRPDAVLIDRTGGLGAHRWLLPHTDDGLLDTRNLVPIELSRQRGAETEDLWIQVHRVGMGWLHLPSGPREVVLQRALILAAGADGRYAPRELVHRWVDPRVGVVAEIRGPVSADGQRRLSVAEASVVDEAASRLNTPGKLYMFEEDRPVGGDIRYGYDQERRCSEGQNLCRTTDDCGGGSDVCPEILISILTPEQYATIGELACDPDGLDVCQTTSWDFSENNLTNYPDMEKVASISGPVEATEVSVFGECGFTASGTRRLSREDKNFDNPNTGSAAGDLNMTASVPERTGGVTSEGNIWLRAGIVNEGIGGAGFLAESRTCHDPDLENRTELPLWRFPHEDATGWYFEPGDTWANDPPFACEQTIFSETIIFQDKLWTSACTGTAIGDLSGTQRTTVVNEGPVTLPSGHTFDAMVMKNVVEYCAYTSFIGTPSCSGSGANQVRVVFYLWEVPHIGTVVRLMSGTSAPTVEGLDRVAETDIKYGLFPPRDIVVDGSGAFDSVDLSWDPGLLTDHIDRYKIYWDTVSGDSNGGVYAYDSESNSGQVAFTGATSATVDGLTAGEQYYFTVTAVNDYCPPHLCVNNPCSPVCPSPATGCTEVACNEVRTYESMKFPLQIGGGAQPVPAEVSAAAGGACSPSVEVPLTMTLDRSGTDLVMTWDMVADPCVSGYQIQHSDWGTIAFSDLGEEIGPTNSHTFDAPAGLFLIVGEGPGGTGPTGRE